MTSRERLLATLNHRQPDRVCVDFGATWISGIHTSIVHQLKQRLIGPGAAPARVHEPYQMLAEVDAELRAALGVDVIGVWPRKNIFGYEANGWKPFTLFDGTPCLVPGNFNVTPAPDGGWLMYPEGDLTAPPSGHMPKGAYFFDTLIRQEPIDEDHLNPEDNLEEFGLLTAADLAHYEPAGGVAGPERQGHRGRSARARHGVWRHRAGAGAVPQASERHPRHQRMVHDHRRAAGLRSRHLREAVRVCAEESGDAHRDVRRPGPGGGDHRHRFRHAEQPVHSPESYRNLFKPYHQKLNELIHRKSNWKIFIHSCGAVARLIPEFIEAGFDILNPVQCSAAGMDAVQLKRNFGKDLTFWGGCVNTQHTMYQTPEAVYREVRERIDIFNQDGGFVCNAVHNVQGNSPIENVLAMFKAIKDSSG